MKEAARLIEGENIINSQIIIDDIYFTEMNKARDQIKTVERKFRGKPKNINVLEINLR